MNPFLAVLLVIGAAYAGMAYADDVVHINGDPYAFIAYKDTIRIVDLSVPHAPLMAYSIPIQSEDSHMVTFHMDKGLYLVAYDAVDDSLHIFDVTSPYSPVSTHTVQHVGAVTGLDIVDTPQETLVMLAYDDTIRMLSVSVPDNPSIVHTIHPVWGSHIPDGISHMLPFGIHDDSYALAVGKTSAQIIDLDEPNSFKVSIQQNVHGFDHIGEFTDAQILEYDSRVYGLLAGHDSVIITDLSSPDNPHQVGVISLESEDTHPLRIDVIHGGDTPYILILDGEILHIADVTQPDMMFSVQVGPDLHNVIGYADGVHLEVLLTGDDLLILDVTDPAQATPAYLRGDQKLLAPLTVETVVIQDSLYVVTISSAGDTIQIFEITNSDDIIPVSEVAGGQFGYKGIHGPQDITIVQQHNNKTYAIIPNVNSNSVAILDISDPHVPVLIHSINDIPEIKSPVGVETFDVGSSSYIAIAVNFINGVFLVDITDIHAPRPALLIRDGQYGFEALSGATGLESVTIDDTVYLLVTGYYDNAVQIIDLTDPLSPAPAAAIFDDVGGYSIGGPHQIKAATMESGTYAVVTSIYDDTITIIDITDPVSPSMTSQITGSDFQGITSPDYMDILQTDGHTYVMVTSYYDASVSVIDMTDPASPILVSSAIHNVDGFDMEGPLGISVKSHDGSTYAAVAAYFGNGIQIIDMTDLSAPRPHSLISSGIENSVALFGSHGMGHIIVDDTPYAISSVFSQDAVRITDISDPLKPIPITVLENDESFALDGPIGVTSGAIAGKPYALISSVWSGAIQVVDMSNPSLPVPASVIGSHADDSEGYRGVVEANLAYVNGHVYVVAISGFEDVVHIADVNDPYNPTHIATIKDGTGGFTFSASQGLDIAYTPNGVFAIVAGFIPGTIQIIDISDPHTPAPASFVTTETENFELIGYMPDITAAQIGNKTIMAAISYRTNTITLADITDPFNIQYINTIQSGQPDIFIHNPESIEALTIGDQVYVAVASINDSIELLNITDPHNPTLAGLAGSGIESTIYGVTDLDSIRVGSSHYILALTPNSDISYIIEITDSGISQVSNIPPVPVR